MVTVTARPRCARLLPFVQSFHYHETDLPLGLERVVPNGQAHLMVNLAEDEFRTYDRVRPALKTCHAGTVLAGPHAQSAILDTRQMRWLAAVQFRPGGVGHFLGIPASEACNQVVSMDAIWRAGGSAVRERLLAAPTPQERFAVFEELLLNTSMTLTTRPWPGRPERCNAGCACLKSLLVWGCCPEPWNGASQAEWG